MSYYSIAPGEIERSSDSRPLRDMNFNVGQGTILATNSDGSTTGNSLVDVYATQPENAAESIVTTAHLHPVERDQRHLRGVGQHSPGTGIQERPGRGLGHQK